MQTEAKRKIDYATAMAAHLERLLEKSFDDDPEAMDRGLLFFYEAIPTRWRKNHDKEWQELSEKRKGREVDFFRVDGERLHLIVDILRPIIIEELEIMHVK